MLAQPGAGGSGAVSRSGALRRLAGSDRAASVVLGTIGVVVAICAMELATKSGFVESRDVPPAFDIIRELLRICITSHFWSVIGETMYQFSIGLAISVAIGIPLGLAIGANDLLWRALRPTIEFLRPVPPVAFLALLLLQYGPSAKSAIILVVLGSVWVLLIQAIYGMRDRDEVMRETARSLGLGWFQRLRSVTLPSVLPYLATGIRLGVAYALIACISAEILVSSPGLGAEAWIDIENDATTLAYAYILAAGLLGLGLHVISARLEMRYLRWHPSQREDRS
jgi:ABC-type nitrate/sulfonate/bicarbonate transport system permease component